MFYFSSTRGLLIVMLTFLRVLWLVLRLLSFWGLRGRIWKQLMVCRLQSSFRVSLFCFWIGLATFPKEYFLTFLPKVILVSSVPHSLKMTWQPPTAQHSRASSVLTSKLSTSPNFKFLKSSLWPLSSLSVSPQQIHSKTHSPQSSSSSPKIPH